MTNWDSPPPAGTITRSNQRLWPQVNPPVLAPEPLATTMLAPSGLQEGCRYWAGSRVSFSGTPPPAAIFQRNPPSFSSQLVNAIERPSGDHEGEYSKGANESGVSRCGVPEGKSMIQIRPTAWNASLLPSGDAVCQRVNCTSKGPSDTFRCGYACSEMVRWTLAVNGIVSTLPLCT